MPRLITGSYWRTREHTDGESHEGRAKDYGRCRHCAAPVYWLDGKRPAYNKSNSKRHSDGCFDMHLEEIKR